MLFLKSSQYSVKQSKFLGSIVNIGKVDLNFRRHYEEQLACVDDEAGNFNTYETKRT